MSGRSIRNVATTFLLAVTAFTAAAANRVVPGTHTTIAAAVAAAQPGDHILVGPGIYQENVVSTVANLQFIGKGAIWDGTLVNGTAGVCLTATGDGVVVQGFIFRAGQPNAAQVQLTGAGCRVLKCSSRGPSARFLKITGNSALVDTCTLYAVNSGAIEIIGDNATVRKVKSRQGDDSVIGITGNGATVTGCIMSLNEDGASINISGHHALVNLNSFVDCDSGIYVEGTNAIVTKNKALNGGSSFISVNSGDNAVVEKNISTAGGSISVTGDAIAVRVNSMKSMRNEASGLTVNGNTAAGGGVVENNAMNNIASTGLSIGINNAVIRGNRVTGAGTESGENACRVSGSGNRLTNNIVIGGGTHGFDITGANNILVKCSAIDSAADGFHIAGSDNTLLICDAMLCTGEGLDNGGTGTTVFDCAFKKNRLDVANDGTFANASTFVTDNTFTTGGPTQLPQVD